MGTGNSVYNIKYSMLVSRLALMSVFTVTVMIKNGVYILFEKLSKLYFNKHRNTRAI